MEDQPGAQGPLPPPKKQVDQSSAEQRDWQRVLEGRARRREAAAQAAAEAKARREAYPGRQGRHGGRSGPMEQSDFSPELELQAEDSEEFTLEFAQGGGSRLRRPRRKGWGWQGWAVAAGVILSLGLCGYVFLWRPLVREVEVYRAELDRAVASSETAQWLKARKSEAHFQLLGVRGEPQSLEGRVLLPTDEIALFREVMPAGKKSFLLRRMRILGRDETGEQAYLAVDLPIATEQQWQALVEGKEVASVAAGEEINERARQTIRALWETF